MEQLFPIFGIALIVVALLQFGLWTGRGLRLRSQERKRFAVELDQIRAEIFQITTRAEEARKNECSDKSLYGTDGMPPRSQSIEQKLDVGDWRGFRQFKVARLIQETEHCKSVYLTPVDEQSIVNYLPGQHLTLRFPVPDQAKPPIRCYTLSDAPNEAYYRISVKRCLPPRNKPDAPHGLVSYFINGQLKEGDVIDVKSPSGTFHIQSGNDPVVLLAGGVGITPMLSIVNSIADSGSGRDCLLVYGVGNSADHAFKHHLEVVAAKHSNIHVVTCYCNPLDTDRADTDYQVKGFVSVDILRQLLPSNNYNFYLCGPPPFMQSLYDGLSEWGVNDDRIRYEAFGPATLKKTSSSDKQAVATTPSSYSVAFRQSNKNETWSGGHENLLEFMEDKGIPVDSGCRAGSCGTCQTRLLKGSVQYEDPDQIECEDGYCLPCVAKPAEGIEIDA